MDSAAGDEEDFLHLVLPAYLPQEDMAAASVTPDATFHQGCLRLLTNCISTRSQTPLRY